MTRSRLRLTISGLLMLACCACAAGPDPVRLAAEKANLALAERCADGWFRGLPFAPHDEQLVRQAFADWRRSLEAEQALADWPSGSPR